MSFRPEIEDSTESRKSKSNEIGDEVNYKKKAAPVMLNAELKGNVSLVAQLANP